MTGIFVLDWSIQAISIFNVILLSWLGLTVMLNAERRSWGIYLASGGLLMGAAFFISHSAILGHDPNVLTSGMNFWWYLGWAPVIFLPFAWYLVMLWYTGFWEAHAETEKSRRHLYDRQRFWFVLTLVIGSTLIILLVTTHLIPTLTQLAQLRAASQVSLQGFGWFVLLYSIYALLCLSLSLDALIHPGPSRRWMGEQARRRAKPWLMAASVLLLWVSLMVGWAMFWILTNLQKGAFTSGMTTAIGVFDLIIAGFIGLSVVILGQAVVSYEIFTARTLPRNGLFLHWRRVLILAGGYSFLVSWSLAVNLRPIYTLLLTTLLISVFFAMLAWRSYAERERFIANLRPFLTGGKIYSNILDPVDRRNTTDITISFRTLCSDIIETQQGMLIPLGEMIQLAGPALLYPETVTTPTLTIDLANKFHSPNDSGLPLDPGLYSGFIWAIPLWTERGLVGMLLIGEKRSGGLFTQEEIETARAVGERLIDLKASVELAHRLALLERYRLAQGQVIDQQARRILHDEILPKIHTALLGMANNPGQTPDEQIQNLASVHRQISDLLHSMAVTTSLEVAHLGFVGALHQVVEQDLMGCFDHVDWQIDDHSASQVNTLPILEAEVFFYAAREVLRNSARYGRSAAGSQLNLIVRLEVDESIKLMIQDNGQGIDLNASVPPSTSSSGQGLELHSTLIAVLGGSLSLESEPGRYTRAILTLPRP